MKRTILPKLMALLLCISCWIMLPPDWAILANVGIVIIVLVGLSVPVLHPQSSFYVPTLSMGKESSGQVALTFDDGPDPLYTPRILDFLESQNIRAAFFLVGSRVAEHPDLVREIISRGHVVGNHSFRHGLNFHFSSPAAIRADLDAFDSIMLKTTGHHCSLFRAPQGFRTPLLADILRQRRLHCIGWKARGYDSVRTDPGLITRSILKSLTGGHVILLHDGGGLGGKASREATLKALPPLVNAIKAQGLGFERVDCLLGVKPYFLVDPLT